MADEYITVPPPQGEIATAANSVNVVNKNVPNATQRKSEIDISLIKNNFAKYIVRPLNAFGLGGFVFDIEGDTELKLGADITDHYSESNVAIQDHIAIKPKEITLKSYVGELVHRLDDTTDTTTQNVVRKLTVLNGYLPALSDAAETARDTFLDESSELQLPDLSFDESVRGAANIYGLVKDLNPPTGKQEQAYMYFEALMDQKILVAVQTPFKFMTNMAIKSLSAVQKENTKDMTGFTITLKQMRFASTEYTSFDPDDFQSRTGGQREDLENKGKTAGKKKSGFAILNDLIFGNE